MEFRQKVQKVSESGPVYHFLAIQACGNVTSGAEITRNNQDSSLIPPRNPTILPPECQKVTKSDGIARNDKKVTESRGITTFLTFNGGELVSRSAFFPERQE